MTIASERRPVAHCPAHHRYTAGCTPCQDTRRAYKAGRRDSERRDALARGAAYRRLAAAHPDEYRRYFAEELNARTPRDVKPSADERMDP